MTELEELKKQKDEINRRISELEKIAREESNKNKLQDHEQYIGKCFVSSGLKKYRDIEAFKIIEFSKYNKEDSVSCVCIIDNCIFRKDIWLWHPTTDTLISRCSDPKIIDLYKEVTQEEFDKVFNDALKRIYPL